MDELDRMLSDEPHIEPSARFTADVMRAVLLASTAPPPLLFPWVHVLTGSAVCGVLAWVGTRLTADALSGLWMLVVPEIAPVAPALGYAALTLCIVLGGLRLQSNLAAAD